MKRDLKYESISHIERVAIIYAVALLQHDIRIIEMMEKNMKIACECEDDEILSAQNRISRLDFTTSSCGNQTTISTLAWTKDWITTNCHGLGLNRTQLGLFCLIYGLSKYDIQNKTVAANIQREAKHFMTYLEKRHTEVMRI
jgi:hypothetical protein